MEMISVGIDIGTSTTQVIFSKLNIQNTSSYFSVPKVDIISKEVIYKSKIIMTPLISEVLIDGDKIKEIVEEEYRNAGFDFIDIQTGAVIITGESALKENAETVTKNLSNFAGDFVVSTAGPDLEAILAGKGSGAQQYSIDNTCSVLNIDIGGGTTNIVLFKNGEVISKGCLDIGGRIIKVNEDGLVKYASQKAKLVSEDLGIKLNKDEKVSANDLIKISNKMNEILETYIESLESNELTKSLVTKGSSKFDSSSDIDYIFFSGGVSEFIYNNNTEALFPYGDIGMLLANSIKSGKLMKKLAKDKTAETIRATVVGAGTYTTSISGATITITKDIFPIKNVPVYVLSKEIEDKCFQGDWETLIKEIKWFQKQVGKDDLIVAFKGPKSPSYIEIKELAKALSIALLETTSSNIPIIIVLESDIAKALGQSIDIFIKGKRDIVCVDNIAVSQGDYVDMGKPILNGLAVPVIVKTLIFG